jgi:hypothetical protein
MAAGSADQFAFGIAASLVFGLLFIVTAIGVWKKWGQKAGLVAIAVTVLPLGALLVTTWQRRDPAPRHVSFQGSTSETLLFIVSDPAGAKVDLSLPLLGTPSLRIDVPANGVVRVSNFAELEPELLSSAAEFNGRTADAQLEVLQNAGQSTTVLCFDFTQPEVPAGEHAARLKARE